MLWLWLPLINHDFDLCIEFLEMPSKELRRTEGTVLSSDSLLAELIPRCGVSEWDNEYVNIEQEACCPVAQIYNYNGRVWPSQVQGVNAEIEQFRV